MSVMANQSQANHLKGKSIADVESVEGPSLVSSRKETWDRVKNVVWIKGNTLYNEALEDWEREIKVKGERLVRREKRSDELTNQIYNVVGFFSVFQGVILTAVTQLTQSSSSSPPSGSATPCTCSRPLCGKVWFPSMLSGLAAVAAVLGIGLKFRDIRRVESLIFKERREQTEVVKRESALRELGENFRFRGLKEPPKRLEKSYSYLKEAGVIGGVLVFTFVFIMSYFVILCDKFVIKGHN